MSAVGLLEQREAIEAAAAAKKKEKADKTAALDAVYEACVESCVCTGTVCVAAGLWRCFNCTMVKKSKCQVAACKAAREANPDAQAARIPKKPIVAGSAPRSRKRVHWPESEDEDEPEDAADPGYITEGSEGELDPSSDSEDELLATRGWKKGDEVRVFRDTEEPPAWFSGVVDRVFKKSLSVYYEAEDLHATHNLDAWQIERRTVPKSVAAEADDSDDEVPLHILFPPEK